MNKNFPYKPDKKLGQHFLLDETLCDNIVLSCPEIDGNTVLEIGPGPGILTKSLLFSKAKKVIAVELDERAIKVLEAIKDDRLMLIHQDALKINEASMLPENEQQLYIIANLPYNIGTALLLKWLNIIANGQNIFGSITVMLQKEVAEKIMASPSTDGYSSLSVIMQLYFDMEKIYDVEPSAFFPPPKVMSSVIKLTPFIEPRFVFDKKIMEKLLDMAFRHKRKMLRNNIANLIPEVENVLKTLNIKPSARAEELSIEDFCALSREIPE